MTISDIENYLQCNLRYYDEAQFLRLSSLKQKAILSNDEDEANFIWCIESIFKYKLTYLKFYGLLCEEKYEEAWLQLVNCEKILTFLKDNIKWLENRYRTLEQFSILKIDTILKEYESAYPYKIFGSREIVVKREHCSICGKIIKLRNRCNHVPGKLYMGQCCKKIVDEFDPVLIALTDKPFDKNFIVIPKDNDYDYGLLKYIISVIHDPYIPFKIERKRILLSKYKRAKRKKKCPCGSGKLYGSCCYLNDNKYGVRYFVHVLNY